MKKDKKEIWKPCPGYERYYDISSMGNVRSFHLNNSSGIADRSIVPHPIAPSYSKSFQYWFIGLSRGIGVVTTHTLHILVAKAFVPNPDKKRYVHHIDNDKQNPCAYNLRWVTAGENQALAYADGQRKRLNGALNGRSKLTEKQVLEIFNSKENHYKLAAKYNIGRGQIGDIKSGYNWSCITGKKYVKRPPIKKLTEKEILEVLKSDKTQVQIAKEYGVSTNVINGIKTGRAYSAITKVKFTGKQNTYISGYQTA